MMQIVTKVGEITGNQSTNNVKDLSKQKMPTILIAEDNEINMMLTTIMLENIIPEAILIEANNGKEAVELYGIHRPDLVFMDIQMPEMNGYKASMEIRKQFPDLNSPIIALTAGPQTGEMERCLRAGMNDYLSKPIIQDSIRMILNKWLKGD